MSNDPDMSDIAATPVPLPGGLTLPGRAMRTSRQSPGAERLFGGAVTGTGMLVLVMLGAIIIMLIIGAWPAIKAFGLPFFWNPVWDSVNDKIRRWGDGLWNPAQLGDRAGAGGAAGHWRRIFPDRNPACVAAASHWHRHPVTGGHPVDHLRNVGLLRAGTVHGRACHSRRCGLFCKRSRSAQRL